MRCWYPLCLFLYILYAVPCVSGQSPEIDESEWWPETTMESRPWTRWWWMGSAVDTNTIERLLGEYGNAGMGGVEITPIYGVRGEEENYIDFLSEEWMDALRFAVRKAREAGMGVDMNAGTGWPFGGPQVSDAQAAKKLHVLHLGDLSQRQLRQFMGSMSKDSSGDLLALSAINSAGQRINLLEDGAGLGRIDDRGRELMAITQKNTGQMVKRAAPGGERLVLNHFSGEAARHYFRRFSEAFGDPPGVRAFFNDSYEVSDASASSGLFPAFKAWKGYDLALYAGELDGRGKEEEVARIKADYREVLGLLLLEEFTGTWNDWAWKYGALTRGQAHGSPGNLIDLYAAVDIPETETFHATYFPFLSEFVQGSPAKPTESNRLFRKFASSAAHMKGQSLVSCETFTWLNEHFQTPLYQCKPEIDELFVQGVTHLFFHGTAYSPERAAWPGWLFYASMHVEPNNPQWDHLAEMNAYITRCQSVLQTGRHTNDFLVYWSPDEYNHDAEGLEKKLTLHNSESWMQMPEIAVLLEKGYQFDFTSDRIISASAVKGNRIVTFGKAAYQCVVIPCLNRINLATFQSLLRLAHKGAAVVFCNLPTQVSGFDHYMEKEQELAGLIRSLEADAGSEYQLLHWGSGRIYVGNIELALEDLGIERETLADHGLKHISRKTEDGVYYFLANHEKEHMDKWITFRHSAPHAILMDPMNGEICLADSDSGAVRVDLQPGASTILYFTDREVDKLRKSEYLHYGNTLELKGPWELKALKGGPELFVDTLLNELSCWTGLAADIYRDFSGTCEYSTVFHLEGMDAANFLLRFEKVEASVRIFINDREVATLWSFPFEVKVGEYLKAGENTLRVEVSNLAANRIRFLDRRGMEWKRFHNINVVDLDYKPLDATDWEVLPSGLGGKVELIELAEKELTCRED